jgi:protein-disulfide isomerase
MSRFLAIAVAGALLTGSVLSAAAEPTAGQKADIEAVVRDYILAHPEIIGEALTTLQARHEQEQKASQAAAIKEMQEKLTDSPHQAILGNPKGAITLVEFFDYNCGYCRRAHPDMVALIKANPDLRLVMKEFPILSEGSVEAARVSVAVKDLAPASYERFHEELFQQPGAANGAKALAIAEQLGLDVAALKKAGNKPDVTENFVEAQQLAQALGISGTPSYVIGGEVIPGAAGFDALQKKVDAVRTCGTATC